MSGLQHPDRRASRRPRARFRLESDAAWWDGMREALRDREVGARLEPFAAEARRPIGWAGGCCSAAELAGRRAVLLLALRRADRDPLPGAAGTPARARAESRRCSGGGNRARRGGLELGRYAGDELDFGPVIQEIVALAWPMQPLCSEDCAGLCSVCGAVRSRQACACETRHDDPTLRRARPLLEESRKKQRRRT